MIGSNQEYQYTECGLSSVRLVNVTVFECSCGSRSPESPAIEQLHTLIAISLLQKETLLSGEEVRFLRKVAGLTQVELSEIMGVHETCPTKWETDHQPIGKENDRVLRSCCLFGMFHQVFNTNDPVAATRAASAALRSMDVREIFKRIKDEQKRPATPKNVEVRNDPDAPGVDGPWYLPDRTPIIGKELCM
jgi:DNA-binding transcriptional regulator YiaG